MIIFNDEIIKDEKRLNTFIVKDRSCLRGNIKMQNAFKDLLLNYMNRLAETSSNLSVKDQVSSIKLLEDFKKYIEVCNENISMVQDILSSIKYLTQTKLYKDLDTIVKLDNKYLRLMSKVFNNTLEIQDFISSIIDYTEFNFSNVVPKLEKSKKNHTEDNKQKTKPLIDEKTVYSERSNKLFSNIDDLYFN